MVMYAPADDTRNRGALLQDTLRTEQGDFALSLEEWQAVGSRYGLEIAVVRTRLQFASLCLDQVLLVKEQGNEVETLVLICAELARILLTVVPALVLEFPPQERNAVLRWISEVYRAELHARARKERLAHRLTRKGLPVLSLVLLLLFLGCDAPVTPARVAPPASPVPVDRRQRADTPRKQPPPLWDRPSSAHVFRVGDVVHLTWEPDREVILYATRSAYDASVTAANAGDDLGLQRLVTEGQGYPVARDTPARILSYDVLDAVLEVRITEGVHKGHSGWVNAGFVQVPRGN